MLSKFDYSRPKNLEGALRILEEEKGARILAGGTDLMIQLRHNIGDIRHIVDIKGIPETHRIQYIPKEGLYIGASVTVNQISRSKDVRNKYLALAQGADNLASYQLRNRATLVGNICNASPGGDLAPPLLVFDGMVEIVGPNGRRMVPLKEFFTGVKRTILKSNELVLGVCFRCQSNDRSTYMKQARLKGHDLATVGVALRIDSDRKVYIAMAAVAPTPIRLKELEETINARTLDKETVLLAVKEVVRHIQPISDVRSSAEYRLHVAGVLLKRGLLTLMDKEVG